MKFIELKQHLQSLKLSITYVLYGEDDSVLEQANNLFKNLVDETFRDFNVVVFDVKETEPQKVIDACNTMPLMAPYKVVVLNDRESKEDKKDAKETNLMQGKNSLNSLILNYLKEPNKTTILVVNTNENSLLFNKLKTLAVMVDCNKLDSLTLKKIILNECKKKKIQINDPEIIKLIDICGGYLGNIKSELFKLASVCDSEITMSDIDNNCQKNLEYTVFELSESLSNKNTERALAILDDMLSSPKNQPLILPLISSHFRRLFMVATSTESSLNKASKLGVKEYAVQKSEAQARKFSKKKLMDITKLINESEFMVKSGKAGLKDTLYYIVLYILNS